MPEEQIAFEDIDIRLVDVSSIQINDYNPNDMESELFEALVGAVKEEGMNQPILVRVDPNYVNDGPDDHSQNFIIVDREPLRGRQDRRAGESRRRGRPPR